MNYSGYFVENSHNPGLAFPSTYDFWLVALSIMVASLAAYATLCIAERIRSGQSNTANHSWLAAGAFVMGIGVWAMHFIGMLAFQLPVTVSYDILTTLLSVVPALPAAAIMLWVINRSTIGWPQLILGGTLMGAGIGLMHYTGMAAMRMEALMLFDPARLALSVVVAVVLAITALYTKFLAFGQRNDLLYARWPHVVSALVMGCAVAGMHYTGMSAAFFFPGDGSPTMGGAMGPHALVLWVTIATLFITGLAILSARHNTALRQRDQQLRTVTNGLPLLIVYLDPKFRLRFVNRIAEHWLGRPNTSLVGQHLSEIHGKEGFEKILPFFNKALAGNRQAFDERVKYPDGKVRDIHIIILPHLDTAGHLQGLYAMVLDISERKQAERKALEGEKQIRDILNNIVDATLTINEQGIIESFNPSAESTFGYSSAEILGQNIACLMSETDQERLDSYINLHLEPDHSKVVGQGPCELLLLRKDGGTFPGELVIGLIRYRTSCTFICTFRDITDRKNAERKLRQAQKFDAIGRLTSGIAHDFNNLLAIILGNLQLLEQSLPDDASEQKRVRTAVNATQRGAALTSRLLAFARQSALEPTVVNLTDLVSEMTELLKRTLLKTISTEFVLPDDIWLTRVDPGQLENVVVNLVVNARDAMPEGGKLSIEIANQHINLNDAADFPGLSAGDYVTLAISDNGCGMAPKVLERVFEPFFTTKEKSKGTGLGLAMAYGFVKQSKGSIDIDTEVGRGTTVTLYFPRTESAQIKTRTRVDPSKTLPVGHERILVVEDEADVREVATAMLGQLGYQVFSAENGPAALVVLQSQPDIDLVFTDMVMPNGMTGVDLANAVQHSYPNMKALLASGYAREVLLARNESLQYSNILQKPYTRQALAYAVREALGDKGTGT